MVRLLQVGFLLLVVALPAAGQASRSAENASLAARLQRFEDKEEIQNLLLDYGRHLDNRDFAAYSRSSPRTASGSAASERLGGRPTSRRSWKRAWARRRTRAKNYHLLSNFVITVNGDTATAWSRWAFVVPGERGAAIAQAGRYDDTLVRENGHWNSSSASRRTTRPAPAPARTTSSREVVCRDEEHDLVGVPRLRRRCSSSCRRWSADRRASTMRRWQERGQTGDDWLTYGLNQSETRFSPLTEINTTNVTRLGLAWSYDVGAGGGGQEATPLVANGTIYGITNWSVVFAVDARTGKEKWRWDPQVNQAAVRPEICCGVVNRGLAIYNGMIFAPVIDGRLQALDADTGKLVWEARVAYPQDHYTLTMAPRIAKGKVIIGASGGDRPTRGFFDAYDAMTGRRAWRFYTVPGDPSKPFENAAMKKAAATWDGRSGGRTAAAARCGTAWPTTPKRISSTSAPATRSRGRSMHRSSKDKDNLYVCSILAVDVDTGELKWHYQVVPGDNWDFDSVQHLILADLHDQRPHAQGDHAGEQERLLLRARSGHRPVHLRAAVLAGHLGEGHRSEDRPADRERRGVLRHRRDPDLSRAAAARTTGRRCRSIR